MRSLSYIFLIIVIMLSACTGGRYRRHLLMADSLTLTNPQQSMTLLDSISDEMCTAPVHEQMYYRLLRIKAADKAYIPQTSDSAILPLIRYYGKHGDKRLRAETYYYAGSTYRDINDAPMALEYFQKTLDGMPEKDDLNLRARTHYQIAELFLCQKLYEKAIDSYKQALHYDSIDNYIPGVVYCLQSIGYVYNNKNLKDSSQAYYNKALDLARKNNLKEDVEFVMGQMAAFYIGIGEFNKADEYLQPALHTDMRNQSSNYSMASDIYMGLSQYDSVKYYCKELLKIGTIYAKKNASRKLVEIYSNEKRYDEMMKYLHLFDMYIDSVNHITATESVAQMDAMYNYQIREKENRQLKEERSKFLMYVILALAACGIIISLSVYYSRRTRQKRLQLELQVATLKQIEQERFEQSEEFIKENDLKIKQLEEQLNTVHTENNDLRNKLEEQKAVLIFANEKAKREREKKTQQTEQLLESESYQIVKEKMESESLLTNKEWGLLDQSVNEVAEKFKTRLFCIYRMSEQEYHMCLLIYIGLSAKNMSILLGRSTSAISLARKRLYAKMFGKEGSAAEFDTFVRSM